MSKPSLHKSSVSQVVLVASLALVALLGGCGTPRPGLSNGSVSACYRAIPAAKAVVHDNQAQLIGVHRIAADKVRGQLSSEAQTTLSSENDTTVCAVAFKGTFGPGQVELAPSNETGGYAVVLVTSRQLHVLASAVLNQLPRSLGKRTI
jgi:hypothetical protein